VPHAASHADFRRERATSCAHRARPHHQTNGTIFRSPCPRGQAATNAAELAIAWILSVLSSVNRAAVTGRLSREISVYHRKVGYALAAVPMRGLAVIALGTLWFGALVGGALYQREIGRILRRVERRVVAAPELPGGLPIERIARDARRLHAELATVSSGTPMARRLGLASAYDDLLAEACRALDIPDTLSGTPPGPERELERLHVEQQLEEAGLPLSP
jgi:hypothetical protein